MRELLSKFPDRIKKLICDGDFSEVHIGESSSQVFKVSTRRKGNLFLKVNPIAEHCFLLHEARILEWLHGKLRVPEVVAYVKDETKEYVVLTEMLGINCVEAMDVLGHTEIVALLAAGLREIHQIDISGCPFDESLETKLLNARYNLDHGLVDESDFDEERQGKTGQEIMASLCRLRPTDEDHVFSHGDYCLPNVILRNNCISGYIDLGRAGISDRYNDLAIASRSIYDNLGEGCEAQFFKEYGVNSVDEDKIEYYRMMDEMF